MLIEILDRLVLCILHADLPYLFPKPLTAAEEQKCFERMEKGDKSAKNKLTAHNLRLVAHIAGKYRNSGEETEELVSIGTFGLMKAVDTFDYHKGARFSTYAARCVENEILMHFRSRKKHLSDISMNEPALTDKDGNTLTMMDLIEDGSDLIEQAELSIQSKQLYGFLKDALDARELEIIALRYGLYGHPQHTQMDVAKKLHISRSYVSRLEKKALSKLREQFDTAPATFNHETKKQL